jgi:hypothetical protein
VYDEVSWKAQLCLAVIPVYSAPVMISERICGVKFEEVEEGGRKEGGFHSSNTPEATLGGPPGSQDITIPNN